MKMKNLIKSRKFWAATVGLIYSVVTQFLPNFPFSEESVIGVVSTVIAYILGTALEDGLAKGAGIDFRDLDSPEMDKGEL